MGGWKCPCPDPPHFPLLLLREKSNSHSQWNSEWPGKSEKPQGGEEQYHLPNGWAFGVAAGEGWLWAGGGDRTEVYGDRQMSRKPWNLCLGLPFGQESIQRKLFHSACVFHTPLRLFLKYSRPINMQVEGSFLSSLKGTKRYLNKYLI